MTVPHWKFAVALVCAFGVLKKFRPGAPFLTPFLEAPEFKNFSNAQVYGQIYNYWTYANVISMVPVFALTDLLRYKPVLVLEAAGLFLTWLLLLYGTSLFHMQLMQICFGISTAADVAYNSYLYAVVRKRHYKRVTSYIRTSALLGKFLAYSLGQALVSSGFGDYLLLNQLTLWPSLLLVPIAMLLPMPPSQQNRSDSDESICNGQVEAADISPTTNEGTELLSPINPKEALPKVEMAKELAKTNNEQKIGLETQDQSDEGQGSDQSAKNAVATLCKKIDDKFLSHYRDEQVRHWSLFLVLTSALSYQVINYIQTLWAHRQVGPEYVWNGFVESVNTLLGALGVFLVQFVAVKWERHSLPFFVFCSAAISALLYAMTHFQSVFVDYALYIVLCVFYNAFATIACNLIATHLTCSNSYGLVFGVNAFAAVLLQCLLTFLFVDSNGPFSLPIEQQFLVYCVYLIAVALIFIVLFLIKHT